MIQRLEDFKTYSRAITLGEKVWGIVAKWNYFEKDTIGKQLVRSMDSVAANLSEGLGRYHVKEIKNFSYYSRGSLFETKTWLTKANSRDLIDKNDFDQLMLELEEIGKMTNGYINSLGENISKVNELEEEYLTSNTPKLPSPNA